MTFSAHLSHCGRQVLKILFLWILLPLFLLSGAAVGSLYLLYTFRPALVAASVQEHLCVATGMPWQIKGEIQPVLVPYPGISVSNVAVLAVSPEQVAQAGSASLFVHVKAVRLYLDVSSLWNFSPRFRFIELEAPTVNLAYDKLNRPLWLSLAQECEIPPSSVEPSSPVEPSPDALAGNAAPVPSLPENAGLNGTATQHSRPFPISGENGAASGAGGTESAFSSIERFLREDAERIMLPVHIHGGTVNSYTEKGRLLLSFSGIEARIFPRSPRAGWQMTVNALFSLPAAGLEVDFSVAAGLGNDRQLARGRLSGRARMTPPGSNPVSGNFSTRFVWPEPGGGILLPDFFLTAETDSLSARLKVDLREMLCTGKVNLRKLSLPRWFGFGRALPPGLQQPMDGLVGEFDLYLNGNAAEARNLRGVVGPLFVRGYVGTPDFSTPVVVVDLDLDTANLDLLFPFLAPVGRYVPDPVSPEFDHLPLAPFPEDPDFVGPQEEGVGVSYDVKVRVAEPRVHEVDAGPLEVLVLPVKVKGAEKTRVSFSIPKLLTGKAAGHIDIHEVSVAMHYDVTGLKLGLLPENKENSVKIDGMLSGKCDIAIPVSEEGNWADDWQLTVDAGITGCEITGKYDKDLWRLFAAKTKAVGKGHIHTVRSDGIRIEGLWDLNLQGIRTSWHPKGDDAISGKFDGGLYWPVIEEAQPPESSRTRRTIERVGVERVEGKLNLSGSLVVPVGGAFRPQIKGKLEGGLDWLLYDETVKMQKTEFTGFGSILTGNVLVDYSGRGVEARSDLDYKINPRELLKGWNAGTAQGFNAPRLLKGKAAVSGGTGQLLFDGIRAEMDGAPITGEINWRETSVSGSGTGKNGSANGGGGVWTARLTADHLNFDTFFPPTPPGKALEPRSKTPWNLKFLKGGSLDAEILLRNAKWDNLAFAGTKVTAALQRDRFSVHCQTASFYNGTATTLVQGTIVPEKSQVTLRKGLMQLQGADLGRALYDFTNERAYGGTADLVIDISGVMQSDADIPSKLSGIWSLNIKDGLYPAFLSKEDSNLRNTFSTAAVGGTLDRGVLRWNDFRLTGTMVDMTSEGWIDLNTRDLDIRTSVTFAKVPTVPVRFYGNIASPRMKVRGVDMVVQTVQAAGNTVFSLVRGVFELPGRAVSGIGSLFGSDGQENAKPKNRNTPATMPVKPALVPAPKPSLR